MEKHRHSVVWQLVAPLGCLSQNSSLEFDFGPDSLQKRCSIRLTRIRLALLYLRNYVSRKNSVDFLDCGSGSVGEQIVSFRSLPSQGEVADVVNTWL